MMYKRMVVDWTALRTWYWNIRPHDHRVKCPICGRSRHVQRTDFKKLPRHPVAHMILQGNRKSALTSFLRAPHARAGYGSRTGNRKSALTSFLRVLPDFLIIGTTKSATTSLYGLMCSHPHVLPARAKEIGYFASTWAYMHGLQWYRTHFPTVLYKRYLAWRTGRRMLTGEATPQYMFFPDVPGRVKAVLPDVRMIAIMRNPVDRAYSEYNMRLRKGKESLTFEDAISVEGNRVSYEREKAASDSRSDGCDLHFYLSKGRYAEQLTRWYKYFDRNQILVLTTEELGDDRQGTLDRVFGFLGLEPFEVGGGNGPPAEPALDGEVQVRAGRSLQAQCGQLPPDEARHAQDAG